MSKAFERFGYYLIIVFLLVMWWNSCHKSTTPIVDNKYKDTLASYRDSLGLSRAHESVLMDNVSAAEDHIVVLGDQADAAESKLAKANKEVNYWIGKVRDSSLYYLDGVVDWNNYSDSLAEAAKQAQTECANVIQIKDSTIFWYQGEVGSLKLIVESKEKDEALYEKMLQVDQNKINQLINQTVARRKLYGGVEGYSTQKAFQSLQVGLLYADKRGNMIGASGGLFLDGSPVLGLKYYKLISFKKK